MSEAKAEFVFPNGDWKLALDAYEELCARPNRIDLEQGLNAYENREAPSPGRTVVPESLRPLSADLRGAPTSSANIIKPIGETSSCRPGRCSRRTHASHQPVVTRCDDRWRRPYSWR